MDLHLKVVGLRRQLPGTAPGGPISSEPWDAYCLATVGPVSLRTRCIPGTLQPQWDEELVFSHLLEDGAHCPTARLDIFQHGALADTRVLWTELDLLKLAPPVLPKQPKQAPVTAPQTLCLPLQHQPATQLVPAAPLQRSSTIGPFRAAGRGTIRMGPQGVQIYAEQLEVVVWWSKQQIMANADVPPIVVSFLPGQEQQQQPPTRPVLPSCTPGPHAVVYEEPCLALVKVMVSAVNLGLTSPCFHYQQLADRLNQAAKDIIHGVKQGMSMAEASASAASSRHGSLGSKQLRASKAAAAEELTQEELAWEEFAAFEAADTLGEGGRPLPAKQQPVYLDLNITLGAQEPLRPLHPVQVELDGTIPVRQCAVFCVKRPLASQEVHFVLSMQQGRKKRPFLSLAFSYNLLQLLEFSPERPKTLQAWRELTCNQHPGIVVPLPGMTNAELEMAAFLADVDFRAGVTGVAAVGEAPAWPCPEELKSRRSTTSSIRSSDAGEGPWQPVVPPAAAASAAATAGREGRGAGSSTDGAVSYVGGSSSTSSFEDLAGSHAAADAMLQQMPLGSPMAAAKLMYDPGQYSEEVVVSRRQMAAKLLKASVAKARSFLRPGQSSSNNSSTYVAVYSEAPVLKVTASEATPTRQSDAGSSAAGGTQAAGPDASGVAAAFQAALGGASGEEGEEGSAPRVMVRAGSIALRRQPLPPSYAQQQQQQQQVPAAESTSGSLLSRTPASSTCTAASTSAEVLGAHPNLRVARGWREGPLVLLHVSVRELILREHPGSDLRLLIRAGPHWVDIPSDTLPLLVADPSRGSKGGTAAPGQPSGQSVYLGQSLTMDPLKRTGSDGSMESTAAPSTPTVGPSSKASSNAASLRGPFSAQQLLQAPVLLVVPAYSNSITLTLLLYRKGLLLARLVARVHGMLPLTVRQHRCTLYFHKCKSRSRRIIGRVLLTFDALLPPQYPGLLGATRLWFSYLVAPTPVPYLASAMRSSISRDEQDQALAQGAEEWLVAEAGVTLPKAAVRQVLATGRASASVRRAASHLARLKAAIIDWVPVDWLDPLAFYYWQRPWYNTWVLWVLSHICLYPSKWLLVMAIGVTLWLLRGAAIRLRRGILVTEVEELLLPPELAEPGLDDASMAGGSTAPLPSTTSTSSLGGHLPQLLSPGSKEAAAHIKDRVKDRLVKVSDKVLTSAGRHLGLNEQLASAGRSHRNGRAALQELQAQLMEGRLDLQDIDVQSLVKELFSKRGAFTLLRLHAPYMWEYALVAQNMLDDLASFAEGLYALATGVDIACSLICCVAMLCATSFMYCFGVGAGVYVLVVFLLRPPLLRGVPGRFGWKPFFRQLPCRSVEEMY